MAFFVYGLCALTSPLCFGLLFRQHRRAPSRLALRSSIAFLCFAVANILLFADLVVFPNAVDLKVLRNIANLVGALILLFALTNPNERSPR
jgi:hypothetical protein